MNRILGRRERSSLHSWKNRCTLARPELFILCTMSVAMRLKLEIQVLENVKKDDVRSYAARAQSRRLMLAGYAERFPDKYWPSWGDMGKNGNPNRQYSQIIVEELARLCKLGISKEDTKVRLKAQIHKRGTAKLPGVSNYSRTPKNRYQGRHCVYHRRTTDTRCALMSK